MRSRGCIIVGMFALASLTSCQSDPFASRYTTTRPDPASLPGEYVLDPDSPLPDGLPRSSAANAAVILQGDGTFRVVDMPDCWLEERPRGTLDKATGRWQLTRHQNWWTLGLRLLERNGRRTDHYLEAMLRDEKPPYRLHIVVGDPDSGRGLVFISRR